MLGCLLWLLRAIILKYSGHVLYQKVFID